MLEVGWWGDLLNTSPKRERGKPPLDSPSIAHRAGQRRRILQSRNCDMAGRLYSGRSPRPFQGSRRRGDCTNPQSDSDARLVVQRFAEERVADQNTADQCHGRQEHVKGRIHAHGDVVRQQ